MTRPTKTTGAYWYDRAHEAEARLEAALTVVRAAQQVNEWEVGTLLMPRLFALHVALAAFEEGSDALVGAPSAAITLKGDFVKLDGTRSDTYTYRPAGITLTAEQAKDVARALAAYRSALRCRERESAGMRLLGDSALELLTAAQDGP